MEGRLKKLTFKISLTTAAFGASLLIAPGALAQTAQNQSTGADSSNTAEVKVENDLNVSSNNTANINNNLKISANTGGNSASKNTGDGTVKTGDITGRVSIVNDVNSNSLNDSNFDCSSLCTVSWDIKASNSHTGADSENSATVNVENDVDITQNNDLDIDNNLDADLNTGDNEADKNTGDGSVKSGDIDFDVSIVNEGNNNSIGGPVEDPKSPPPAGPKTPTPGKPSEKGRVLAATKGLPVTGGNLPVVPALALILAGLFLRRMEEVLRGRFLTEKS
ncbi:MAG: hypothetical protein WD231_03630 [Candidatus Woykebacteria bacterium]